MASCSGDAYQEKGDVDELDNEENHPLAAVVRPDSNAADDDNVVTCMFQDVWPHMYAEASTAALETDAVGAR
eukprot:COSAG01_NODE_49808_length_369_cov_0.366667_1_plen_71_part_10